MFSEFIAYFTSDINFSPIWKDEWLRNASSTLKHGHIDEDTAQKISCMMVNRACYLAEHPEAIILKPLDPMESLTTTAVITICAAISFCCVKKIGSIVLSHLQGKSPASNQIEDGEMEKSSLETEEPKKAEHEVSQKSEGEAEKSSSPEPSAKKKRKRIRRKKQQNPEPQPVSVNEASSFTKQIQEVKSALKPVPKGKGSFVKTW